MMDHKRNNDQREESQCLVAPRGWIMTQECQKLCLCGNLEDLKSDSKCVTTPDSWASSSSYTWLVTAEIVLLCCYVTTRCRWDHGYHQCWVSPSAPRLLSAPQGGLHLVIESFLRGNHLISLMPIRFLWTESLHNLLYSWFFPSNLSFIFLQNVFFGSRQSSVGPLWPRVKHLVYLNNNWNRSPLKFCTDIHISQAMNPADFFSSTHMS